MSTCAKVTNFQKIVRFFGPPCSLWANPNKQQTLKHQLNFVYKNHIHKHVPSNYIRAMMLLFRHQEGHLVYKASAP